MEKAEIETLQERLNILKDIPPKLEELKAELETFERAEWSSSSKNIANIIKQIGKLQKDADNLFELRYVLQDIYKIPWISGDYSKRRVALSNLEYTINDVEQIIEKQTNIVRQYQNQIQNQEIQNKVLFWLTASRQAKKIELPLYITEFQKAYRSKVRREAKEEWDLEKKIELYAEIGDKVIIRGLLGKEVGMVGVSKRDCDKEELKDSTDKLKYLKKLGQEYGVDITEKLTRKRKEIFLAHGDYLFDLEEACKVYTKAGLTLDEALERKEKVALKEKRFITLIEIAKKQGEVKKAEHWAREYAKEEIGIHLDFKVLSLEEVLNLTKLYKTQPKGVIKSVLWVVGYVARAYDKEALLKTVNLAELYKTQPKGVITSVFDEVENVARWYNKETLLKTINLAELYKSQPEEVIGSVFYGVEKIARWYDEEALLKTVNLAELYKSQPEEVIKSVFDRVGVFAMRYNDKEALLKTIERYETKLKEK